MMFRKRLHQLIQSPILTEKAFSLSQHAQYVFVVDAGSNKIELSSAFEALFPGRKVVNVRTIRIPAKQKRAGRKPTFRKAYSKAIFTIEGEPIELIPGV
jgi:large subunit ribosomal protein L23